MKLLLKKGSRYYIDVLNEIVGESAKFADKTIPDKDKKDEWNQIFIKKMNETTIESGLRIPMDSLIPLRGKDGDGVQIFQR